MVLFLDCQHCQVRDASFFGSLAWEAYVYKRALWLLTLVNQLSNCYDLHMKRACFLLFSWWWFVLWYLILNDGIYQSSITMNVVVVSTSLTWFLCWKQNSSSTWWRQSLLEPDGNSILLITALMVSFLFVWSPPYWPHYFIFLFLCQSTQLSI